MISYIGRQDNLAVREAALFALAISLLMVVAAIVSIVPTIPNRQPGEGEVGVAATDPAAGRR